MKNSLLIITCMASSVLTLHAQNALICPDACGFGSDTLTISVDIENSDAFVGFQFDLPLPEQATYINNSASLTSRADGHILNASLLPGATLRILSYSMNLSYFQGNGGPVVEFRLLLGDVPGIYPLEMENAIIADENSQNILTSLENGNLILIGPVAPNGFCLLSPDSGEFVETLTPTLLWENALDPDPLDSLTYTLYWSLDSTWLSADSITGLTNTEYTFTQANPLPPDVSIWWKVKATDYYQLFVWSNQIWSFLISSTKREMGNDDIENLGNFRLLQNYPNPFNSSTCISFSIPYNTGYELSIYNVQGRLVKRWESSSAFAGIFQIVWNCIDRGDTEMPGGIYFYRLCAGNYVETRKMVLLK